MKINIKRLFSGKLLDGIPQKSENINSQWNEENKLNEIKKRNIELLQNSLYEISNLRVILYIIPGVKYIGTNFLVIKWLKKITKKDKKLATSC